MMEHIIKSLATKDTATVILVLGLTREARLWHKQILEHNHKKPSNQGHCNRHLGTRLNQRSTSVAQTNLRTQT
nr:MAG TPA: hypothetical protein [Caudoviricetes sp.]